MGYEGANWLHPVQDGGPIAALMNTEMNLLVPWRGRFFYYKRLPATTIRPKD